MRRCALVCSLLVALMARSAGEVAAHAPQSALLSQRSFTVTVQDHDGTPKEDATVTIRDGETYELLYQVHTNAYGQATVTLTDWAWYVVTATAPDHGVQEFWYYNYVLPDDWNDGPSKILRRKDPWIDTVTLPAEPVPVGEPMTATLTIDHDHDATNYDLKVKVSMIVDDDGQEPYLYQVSADTQNFFMGIEPFEMVYTPDQAGDYQVRFVIERQFEENPWYVADEGGWEWSLRAGQVEPTPTPVPCSLGGTVFVDGNRDGTRSVGEAGVADAQVHLCTATGDVLQTEYSGADGGYVFDGLPPGDYLIGLGRLFEDCVRGVSVIPVVAQAGEIREDLDFGVWSEWRVGLPCVIK